MKRKTIRKHKDFCFPRNGLRARADCFIIKARPAMIAGDARYGLIASKRAFKLAVLRNRAKRVIRDWIAANEKLMSPDLDYVFIIHDTVINHNRDEGRKKLARALARILKLRKQNAKKQN